jgi:hypothetical protein
MAASSASRIMRISEAKCNEWIANPLVNPITGANIVENGPTYNALKERCKKKYNVRLPGVNYESELSDVSDDSRSNISPRNSPGSANASTRPISPTSPAEPPLSLTPEQSQQLALISEDFKNMNKFLFENYVGHFNNETGRRFMILSRKARRLGISRNEILRLSRVPKIPGQKIRKSDHKGSFREALINTSLNIEDAGRNSPEYIEFRNILTNGGDIRTAIAYGIEHMLELNSMFDEYEIFSPMPFSITKMQFSQTYTAVHLESIDNDIGVIIPEAEDIYKLAHATFNMDDIQKYNMVLYEYSAVYDDDANIEKLIEGRVFANKSAETAFLNTIYYQRVSLRKHAIEHLLQSVLYVTPLPTNEKIADLTEFLRTYLTDFEDGLSRQWYSAHREVFMDIRNHLIPDIREELTHMVNRENADIAYSESDGPASLSSDTGRSREIFFFI